MTTQAIESTLVENRTFPPSEAFLKTAQVSAEKLQQHYARAQADHEGFWCDLAREELTWTRPFSIGLNASQAPLFQWFEDGELNVSYNCLDRHLDERGSQVAIIFEGERGDVRKITYHELHADVCRFANALKNQGLEKGDRAIIYMPMIAEATIAMLACARIGVTHSVVFGGFSADALRDRIEDSQAKVVITADGGYRGGKVVRLKEAVDKALEKSPLNVRKVIVHHRLDGEPCGMHEGRDIWWKEAEAGMSNYCDPVAVSAEHPLFILYTSGSTGKPKGVQHSSAGYLLGTIVSMKWVFDVNPNSDVFWCTADVGWITGHSYVTYGPLAVGATQVIYEGTPTVPDAGRFWKVCQDHGVTTFYTAPTAIRALMKLGNDIPKAYDLSKLRLLGSVGEPINPEAWMWYYTVIGQSRCPIVDTWWQTETGMNMMAPLPQTTILKPGSCTRPLPGISVAIMDEEGREITAANQGGFLVITQPWPSMIRTIWGDESRFKDTYFGQFGQKVYVAGDNTRRDEDGYYWIMGRTDDVLNVSGHRLGTMEIESALVAHERVAEAAVVGKPHDVKGEAVLAFVICKGERPLGKEAEDLEKELRNWVGEMIGPIAKPDEIRFAENLPKTRSGKIMRRLLKTIGRGETITSDTSTLENPQIIDQLQGKA
jgi:acetyl-CoA synthetase